MTATPPAGRRLVTLTGGPCDGYDLDVTGWTADELTTGVAMIVPGSDLRACYGPPPGEPDADTWPYEGDLA